MANSYEPLFHCHPCLDTGWRPFRCDGNTTGNLSERDAHLPMYRCGRRPVHYAHGYVERCGCVDTNPVIAKRRQPREEAVPA